MVILQESASPQTFNVIPRSYTVDSMDITQEGTDVTVNYTLGLLEALRVDYNGTADSEGTYLQIRKVVALEENYYYNLEVKNGSTVVYRDRIFCTNQTVSTYTVNENQYTQNSTDNEFIFID